MGRAALLALAAVALAAAALVGPAAAGAADELALWQNGAHLRGADLYQRRMYPDVDGDALGPGPLGPPLRQKDFDQLARMGANLVVLSHPGIFTEQPPYALDEGAAANLDRLVAMATRADLFVVIAFRTGPGRSEFTFFPGQADTWFPGSLVNETVWSDAAAQQGWVDMWRATAERYRDQPAVVGYELMVEPNGNQVLANEYDPAAFVRDHAGQLVDWNQLHPRIAAAIREVDAETPLLLPYEGWSGLDWLPFLQPSGDPRTVAVIHHYDPFAYTHQDPPARLGYPGPVDVDEDGTVDRLDRTWLRTRLRGAVETARALGLPLAVTELGAKRWVPGAARYVGDELAILNALGVNSAVWSWQPSWGPTRALDDFAFRHGPKPRNHKPVANALATAIAKAWSKNDLRPSDLG